MTDLNPSEARPSSPSSSQRNHHHQGSIRLGSRRRRPFRILVGITGSVAAIKGPELVCQLVDELSSKPKRRRAPEGSGSDVDDDDDVDDDTESSVEVRVVLTRGGSNFWKCAPEYDPKSWRRLQELLHVPTSSSSGGVVKGEETSDKTAPPPIVIYESDHEWRDWKKMGDPVLHIDLRNWADTLVVAPLSAHTLAKFATGLCDDTLSCVVRAWFSSTASATTATKIPGADDTGDLASSFTTNKPLIVAPAMNTAMWEHPITARQLHTLQSFAPDPTLVTIVAPQVKTLACGEVGDGALAPVHSIVEAVAHVKRRMEREYPIDVRGF